MEAAPLLRSPGEHWVEADGVHVEVRGLLPPNPFVTIIGLIERLAPGQTLTVHHDRDPVPLYAELAERGWLAERIAGEPGEVRLLLRRDA